MFSFQRAVLEELSGFCQHHYPLPKAHENIATESMLQFHNNLKCSFTNTGAKQVYHQEAVLNILTVFEDTRSKNSTG